MACFPVHTCWRRSPHEVSPGKVGRYAARETVPTAMFQCRTGAFLARLGAQSGGRSGSSVGRRSSVSSSSARRASSARDHPRARAIVSAVRHVGLPPASILRSPRTLNPTAWASVSWLRSRSRRRRPIARPMATCGVGLAGTSQASGYGALLTRNYSSGMLPPMGRHGIGGARRFWATRPGETQSPLSSSDSVTSSASAIRLAVGIVGECQPRSISPRYFASIRGMRRATASSVSSRASRAWRIASPSLRESGSARVRLGNGGGLIAVHEPTSLDFFCGREHSTCSPSESYTGHRPQRSARQSPSVFAWWGGSAGLGEGRR